MNVIRMDTEQARLTIEQIRAAYDELKETFRLVSASVEQLEAAWEGQAQRQFMGVWDTWLADLSQRFTDLETLGVGLAKEREELIRVDIESKFG